MTSLRVRFFLMLLALSWACAGCPQGGSRPAPSPEKVTIALATLPDAALAHIAQARDLFREHGLEVTVHLHRYGKPALQEVLEGKADVATVAETPVMYAVLAGEKVSVLATIMNSSLSHAILARRDSGISQLKDLKGKRVALTPGTTSDFYLHSMLLTHGLSKKDVRVVELKAEEIHDALTRGEVDAASAFLPYTVMMEKTLGNNAVSFRDTNVYRESFNLASTRAYVQAHPERVKKLLRALLAAEDFARSHPAEAQKIVAKSSGLELDTVREFWADTTFSITLDQPLLLSLEDESEWAIRTGLAKAVPVPNYLDYIHLDGLRSLKPDAVRILR